MQAESSALLRCLLGDYGRNQLCDLVIISVLGPDAVMQKAGDI